MILMTIFPFDSFLLLLRLPFSSPNGRLASLTLFQTDLYQIISESGEYFNNKLTHWRSLNRDKMLVNLSDAPAVHPSSPFTKSFDVNRSLRRCAALAAA